MRPTFNNYLLILNNKFIDCTLDNFLLNLAITGHLYVY